MQSGLRSFKPNSLLLKDWYTTCELWSHVRIPLLHNVVIRVRNRSARFLCVFGTADGCEFERIW